MFGWFKRKQKSDPERCRLEMERARLVLEGCDKDLLSDAAACSISFAECVELVRSQPDAAANLLHLSGRAWLNTSEIVNHMDSRPS